MNFFKRLFGKKHPEPVKSAPTAPVPEVPEQETVISIGKEIRQLDAIDSISPKPQKEAHWRTLHPLVQACLLSWVGWEHEQEVPISPSDAFSVFHRWGYPGNSYTYHITPRQQELMAQYDSIKETLWQQYKAATQKFSQLEEEARKETEQAWQAYRTHYETLPPQTQALVGWELAKRGASQGRSGFHWGMGSVPFPFAACGWADYDDPQWGSTQGVAFRINRDCFGKRKPLLYYLDDDNWPRDSCEPERTNAHLEIIRRYSSGISNVRTEQRRCVGWNGEEDERQVVLFELDPAAIKATVQLSGQAVPTEKLGRYVFVLPRAGEFYCLLGEVREGEMIPLHKDDFCMK